MTYRLIVKVNSYFVAVYLFSFVLFSCQQQAEKEQISILSPVQQLEQSYLQRMDSLIIELDSISATLSSKSVQHYLNARRLFKAIEPVLAFVDRDNYKTLNGPNILKVHEEDPTDIKHFKPFGFQAIEELIYEEHPNWEEVDKIATITKNRLRLIHKNTVVKLKEYHILWLIRDQVARIALTGITGFDSPVLEASLKESAYTYETLLEIFELYQNSFTDEKVYQTVITELENTIATLNQGEFNTFDRFDFIQNHSHQQLALLQQVATDWEIEFPLELALKNDLTSFFSAHTFNLDYFSDQKEDDSLFQLKVELGKELFNDVRLSAKNDMSCATCHNSNLAFTDGLKAFPKQLRNTPTLVYSVYQQLFFHDGRAGSLEGQIVSVVNNPNEFHSDLANLEELAKSDEKYKARFTEIYGETIKDYDVRNAIASYIKTLGGFNSKFDKNINNEADDLTKDEQNGFNLFMGKAKCATCHFPPLFNGTVPPYFTESELEMIGVPNDTLSNTLSTDLGRYHLFNTEERKHFFKTPTIRNVSKTAPYMHNGVYTNLRQVVELYNNGGLHGEEPGFEYQTLPTDSLHLSNEEINHIILFMESLTDEEFVNEN